MVLLAVLPVIGTLLAAAYETAAPHLGLRYLRQATRTMRPARR